MTGAPIESTAILNFAPPAPAPVGVPVGTILPYIGPLSSVLPNNWVLCDGRTIADPESPFNGQRVPNLTDERFLMGIAAAEHVATLGGDNALASDGGHAHSCSFVGYAAGEINYQRGPGHGDPFQMQYGASPVGAHNHGGDRRPRYCGVYFMLRIK
jgi:hypothetical protein